MITVSPARNSNEQFVAPMFNANGQCILWNVSSWSECNIFERSCWKNEVQLVPTVALFQFKCRVWKSKERRKTPKNCTFHIENNKKNVELKLKWFRRRFKIQCWLTMFANWWFFTNWLLFSNWLFFYKLIDFFLQNLRFKSQIINSNLFDFFLNWFEFHNFFPLH